MLRSNCKSLMNHVVSPGEEKERLQWEGFAGKEGFVDYRVVCILPCRETTTPCSFPPLCFRGASNNDPAHTPHTTRSTQPCIPPGSLNRVPASAGLREGMSPLPGGR